MEAVHTLTLSAMVDESRIVVRVSGDLDLSSNAALLGVVEAVSAEAPLEFVMDCEEVTFIDSEALKCLLGIKRILAKNGKRLRLANCSPRVKRILDVVGLDDDLNLWDATPNLGI